ncbi:MAG: hypothetical protein J2P57_25195 [Acidimicrobiaceae bacterium]|nr:hypothetical protein [Acidimicrobiaceae bacterium]
MTVWGHRRGGKAAKPEPTEPVVDEAVALLSGRCVERFTGTGRRVPRWAWLNAVAHAQPEDLQGISAAGRLADPGSWAAAIGRVADELLDAADSPDQVGRLQAELVVPLELDVLADNHRLPVRPRDVDRLLAGRLAPPEPPGG